MEPGTPVILDPLHPHAAPGRTWVVTGPAPPLAGHERVMLRSGTGRDALTVLAMVKHLTPPPPAPRGRRRMHLDSRPSHIKALDDIRRRLRHAQSDSRDYAVLSGLDKTPEQINADYVRPREGTRVDGRRASGGVAVHAPRKPLRVRGPYLTAEERSYDPDRRRMSA